MSKTRSLLALAVGLGILAAAPQTTPDGLGVTVDLGNSAIMHRSSVRYPDAALRAKVEGTVVVEAMLDSSGDVTDAHVLSGPNELRGATLQSVLQWHFVNDSGANTRQVRINFKLPAETSPRVTGGVPAAVIAAVPSFAPVPPAMAGKTLKSLRVLGLDEDAKNRLISRLPIHEGDILSADYPERFFRAVREYDEHLNVRMIRVDAEGNMAFVISPSAGNGIPTPMSASAQPEVSGRIIVGGNVQADKLVSQIHPVYPPLAKQARISGTVKLAAVIGRDGSISNLSVISGHPLLIPAALEAVKQWKYQPTLLNGAPVEVSTQIDINFTLEQ